MAISVIKRLAVARETTFATSMAAYTGGDFDFVAVPAREIAESPTQLHLDRGVQTANLAERLAGVAGPKGWTLNFKVPLAGLSTAATSGVAAVPHPWLSALLLSCGYAQNLGTGTVVDTPTASTTIINVTSAASIAVGSAVIIESQVRVVTATDTGAAPDTITITPGLSAAPANSAVVRAAARYVPTDADPGSCSFAVLGDGYTYVLKGGKGTVKFSATAQELLMLEFSFTGADWSTTAPTGTFPTLTLASGITAANGNFYWGTTATPVRELAFDPALTVTPRLSTGGTNGVAGYTVTEGTPAATAKPYYTAQLQTDYSADTLRSLLVSFGTTGTATFAIYAHQAQIAEYPGEKSVDGILGHELKWLVKSSGSSTVPVAFSFSFC